MGLAACFHRRKALFGHARLRRFPLTNNGIIHQNKGPMAQHHGEHGQNIECKARTVESTPRCRVSTTGTASVGINVALAKFWQEQYINQKYQQPNTSHTPTASLAGYALRGDRSRHYWRGFIGVSTCMPGGRRASRSQGLSLPPPRCPSALGAVASLIARPDARHNR